MSAANSGKAAVDGDIVVVTVPVKAFGQLPAELLAGKTVIDPWDYYRVSAAPALYCYTYGHNLTLIITPTSTLNS